MNRNIVTGVGQEVNRQDYEDYDDYDDYSNYNIPITKDIQLDNKIISSSSKNKMLLIKPIVKVMKFAVPLRGSKGGIMYAKKVLEDGTIKKYPVIQGFETFEMLVDLEKEEKEFPIEDWFNDSVTSTIMEKREARYLRQLDDFGFKLMSKMIQNPTRVKCYGFLQRLHAQKMSIVETCKGTEGRAVEWAKTQISKSESTNYLYRKDREELEQIRQREAELNSGLLGFGIKIPLIGIRL